MKCIYTSVRRRNVDQAGPRRPWIYRLTHAGMGHNPAAVANPLRNACFARPISDISVVDAVACGLYGEEVQASDRHWQPIAHVGWCQMPCVNSPNAGIADRVNRFGNKKLPGLNPQETGQCAEQDSKWPFGANRLRIRRVSRCHPSNTTPAHWGTAVWMHMGRPCSTSIRTMSGPFIAVRTGRRNA